MQKYKIIPESYHNIVIERAMGVYIYDKKGNKYTDLSGSAGMAILGYNNKDIKRLIKKQIDKLVIAPQKYQTTERDGLAKRLISLFPDDYDAIIPTVTGSETVESAMQVAAKRTNKKYFLSFDRAYHGRTFAAGSLGEGGCGMLKNNFKTVAPPHDINEVERAITGIKRKLSSNKYAAFVAEGVITNGGYFKPPTQFYRELFRLCRQYGVLLIFDEVLTGFGRTGRMFSFEHHGLKPDMICISKGIAAGYVAMGAVITTEKLAKGYECYSAFTWPPIGCVIGALNIDIIVKDKLVAHSRDAGNKAIKILKKYLNTCPLIKNINGVGLGIALEFHSHQDVRSVYSACLQSGVIVFRKFNTNMIMIQPPLIIKEHELLSAVKKIVRAIILVYEEK